MRVEVPDLISEWLQDATYGVNALLGAVPRKAGDAAPPNITSFLVETRSVRAALARMPKDPASYPVLLIMTDGDLEFDIASWLNSYDSLNYPITIAYAVREVAADVGTRDAGYTYRAILRSLRKLFDPGITAAATARNNVHGNSSIAVQFPTKVTLKDAIAELEDCVILGGVALQLRVRDNLPGG